MHCINLYYSPRYSKLNIKINPVLFAVLYLSLLNNFDEVRLFFVAETNLEFGLILSVLEHQFWIFLSEARDCKRMIASINNEQMCQTQRKFFNWIIKLVDRESKFQYWRFFQLIFNYLKMSFKVFGCDVMGEICFTC